MIHKVEKKIQKKYCQFKKKIYICALKSDMCYGMFGI
jgi:hypothetical protein